MNVRPARISDLRALRSLEGNGQAVLLAPPPAANLPSTMHLSAVSHWRGMGGRSQTLILNDSPRIRGFIQARARPGRESWDMVRLACQAPDAERWESACAALLERMCTDTAERGALRTFARLPSDSDHLDLMTEHAFRSYAAEISLCGTPRTAVEQVPSYGLDVRARQPRDAWDIFSLYCACTPALVRHAESRSLKEWSIPHRFAGGAPWRRRPIPEVVLGEMGNPQAWLRWRPAHGPYPQLLEILTSVDAAPRIPELLRFAVEHLGLDADSGTICRVREYDGRVSATLEEIGFEPLLRETLLVRHTVAWVTERQLLVAALRAQGLGLELSHYRRGVEALHQRLASSREAPHYYDRDDRASNYG
ncbi:MAG: hypothetical protein ACRDIE_20340 [Chloroflexota bacterium]